MALQSPTVASRFAAPPPPSSLVSHADAMDAEGGVPVAQHRVAFSLKVSREDAPRRGVALDGLGTSAAGVTVFASSAPSPLDDDARRNSTHGSKPRKRPPQKASPQHTRATRSAPPPPRQVRFGSTLPGARTTRRVCRATRVLPVLPRRDQASILGLRFHRARRLAERSDEPTGRTQPLLRTRRVRRLRVRHDTPAASVTQFRVSRHYRLFDFRRRHGSQVTHRS